VLGNLGITAAVTRGGNAVVIAQTTAAQVITGGLTGILHGVRSQTEGVVFDDGIGCRTA
jgi:hypothetical protein